MFRTHVFTELAVRSPPQYGVLFVSPLAALAFELCVEGDTGLKTGWVRCKHGARWGGAGPGWEVVPWKTCVACFRAEVTKSRVRHNFTAVLSILHVRVAPALDNLPALQIRSVKGTRLIRVASWSNDEVAHQKLPSNFSISFEAEWRSQDFELPRLKQVEACESCDLRPPTLEVSWHAKLRPLT